MSVNLVFANVGTGKTTFLAYLTTLKKNKKRYDKIYCNVPIKDTYMLDLDCNMLGRVHIENALILIDEGAIVYDNRKNLTDITKYFMRMHRHYNCDIWIVSQSYEDINIVIRRLYNKIYIAKKCTLTPWRTKLVLINKKIGINEETHQIEEQYFYQPIIIAWISNIKFNRRKYYHLFNSFDKKDLDPFEPMKYIFAVETKIKKKIRETL